MANRARHRPWVQGFDHTVLSFTFFPQGASTPVLGEGCKGWVASVAHTSTGVFTITLSDQWAACVGHDADIQMNAATDLNTQWGAIDVVSAKTLVLRILSAGVATDIAANANNSVSVQLVLRNSTQLP